MLPSKALVNDNDPARLKTQISRVLIIEGLANLLMIAVKIWVGLSSGSLAVLSDAVHSLTDLANNFVAWIVVQFSFNPPDNNHPYGHRKFEMLAVFFLASLLCILAFELFVRVFQSSHEHVTAKPWEIGLMLGVLCVNILVSRWQAYKAKQLDSSILKADAQHTFADALATLAVISGWLLSAAGWVWMDKACALAVGLLVLYLAYDLFRQAAPTLVDEVAISPEEVADVVNKFEDVQEVYNIRSRHYGQSTMLDLKIRLATHITVAEAHTITQEIKTCLRQRFGAIETLIEVSPPSN